VAGKAKTLIILDRAISLGQEGPVASEVKNALYPLEKRPKIVGFVGGWVDAISPPLILKISSNGAWKSLNPAAIENLKYMG